MEISKVIKMSEVPTVEKFLDFVHELDCLCKKYNVTYTTIQNTAKLLDDFGWEHHPKLILSAIEKTQHHSEQEQDMI